MKKHIVIIVASLIILQITNAQEKTTTGNLVKEEVPEIPIALMEKMNQYQNTRSAALVGWSNDGKSMLISTRFGDVPQLHKIDHPGGSRQQLTFFKEPITNAIFVPGNDNSSKFFFQKDVGGNEFTQLFTFDINSGNYEMISDGGRSINSLPLYSNKADQFVTVSTKRNGKDYDLYIGRPKQSKETKLLLQQGGSWAAVDWSPDDKYLLVRKNTSINKSQYFILNIQTSELEEINPTNEDVGYGDAVWAADGKGIFIISDNNSEFRQLQFYNLMNKSLKPISSSINWDVNDLIISNDRKTIVFSTNENGITKLYLLNAADKTFKPIAKLPEGQITNLKFNPKNTEIAMTINTPQTPGDVYSYNYKSNQLTRWTHSEAGGLNANQFVKPTLIQYETFDKVDNQTRKIPAYYYKPKKTSGKSPVLINIHGGPESQFLPSFNPFYSYLTNELGIAMISPNVRGSSGYGKSYLKLDNGMLREESVKDIGALLDWIAKQPELDASKVVVYGGSYGGYMVLASMVHYNDKLKCGIDVVGISNFITFLQNTEDYRKDLRRVEYGDERDPQMKEFLTKISPANNVEKITKPLFIIQGQNDPRVPASESEQMKEKIKEKNGEVWYLLAKDEGHGFKKKANIDYMQWAIIKFLQEKLIP